MFDIGFQELIIIFVVALLVFGPKKLPELARTMGKWMAEIRKGVYVAKSQIENELNTDVKAPDEETTKDLPKSQFSDVTSPEENVASRKEEEKA